MNICRQRIVQNNDLFWYRAWRRETRLSDLCRRSSSRLPTTSSSLMHSSKTSGLNSTEVELVCLCVYPSACLSPWMFFTRCPLSMSLSVHCPCLCAHLLVCLLVAQAITYSMFEYCKRGDISWKHIYHLAKVSMIVEEILAFVMETISKTE